MREDYPGRDAHLPDVLRGDPELTRTLIYSLDTKWRFTAGALSWHPDDTVTPEQERQDLEALTRQQFSALQQSSSELLKSALSTTEAAILRQFTSLEQNVT